MIEYLKTRNEVDSVTRLLAGHAAATIYEAIGQRGEVGPSIWTITLGRRIAGPAYTVRCKVGDARPIWHAIANAPVGSILAIDCGGTPMATAIGGTSILAASMRGIVGFVTNGAVRDVAEIRASDIGVFAAGISVRGTSKVKSDGFQEAIVIGQAVVQPGDYLVGDDDGVVVIAKHLLPELPDLLARQAAKEASTLLRIRNGESFLQVLGV